MKTKSYVGTVFSQTKKSGVKYLYYKTPLFKNGKTISTGLIDTPAHRKLIISKLKEYQYNQFESVNESEKYIYELFDMFFNYCINIKKLTPKTLQGYKYAFEKVYINNFSISDKVIVGNKQISKVESELSNIYKLSMNQNSKSIIMRSVLVFVNWLIEENYIQPFIFKKYKIQQQAKKIEIFTDDEISKILNEAKNTNYKVYQFLLFLANTGARGKEALQLTFDNIDFVNGLITFPNKINKNTFQTIPINKTALELCKELYKETKTAPRKNVFDYKISSIRYISKVLTGIMSKLDIDKNGKLHIFRKYYATKIVESGASPFETQKLVRHANIQTTIAHYYLQDNKKLTELVNKISTAI